MKLQLFCTFCRKSQLNNVIYDIIEKHNIIYDKIFVLDNITNPTEYLLTYNIDLHETTEDMIPSKTISIHRKKESNTLYTINALNFLISLLNDGVESKDFLLPWNNYKNILLVTNNNELKKIETKIKQVINVDEYKKQQQKLKIINSDGEEEINYNR